MNRRPPGEGTKNKNINETSPKRKTLGSPIPLRLDEDTEIMIEAIGKKNSESNQEVMRRLLDRGAKEDLLLLLGADTVLNLVRKAMAETNKPFEERTAKLIAKVGIASATAMYTNLEVIGQLGRTDIRTTHERARKKAVNFIRTKTEDFEQETNDGNDLNE